ncbi:glycosyltransferase family 4 protein [Vibrio crassostreae]|uniref:glycosyltransferase family 4 protein n=1 Tax=Vibrio crassostreae TaxID=246167 RepID=UPI00063540BA|nr:glycosyltransferase family 4 protein [Vibrio crassostreae]TCT51322.1 glycosyltransferase involved in cell wall biosynthesis [Vibrio crassostreae]TCT70267.1 glycosyltransferase involved in cell wall biosynthesis [Vibrio crassostreae]TCT76151.1 glycosyltransferase involved in cell wall biosynthesis [Vibrio crassostreae]TCT95341.1 glycosyltransferase involved in cell wall biosynthesis [Vibrio crassostreae]CAK2009782.1 putative Group 1 glycosyl transferase [Vibrio crassostreae]
MVNVIISSKYNYPAYKAGGPIQSVFNMIDMLKGNANFKFKVLSSNEDIDGTIISNEVFSLFGKSEFYYSRGIIRYTFKLLSQSRKSKVLYLNSLFDPVYTLIPLLLFKAGLISPEKVIVAPRGQLYSEAISKGYSKKKLYLRILKKIGVFNSVHFHATSIDEVEQIRKENFSEKTEVSFIENVPDYSLLGKAIVNNKMAHKINITYAARVVPHKNLLFALKTIKLSGCCNVHIDAYGAIEDAAYYSECVNFSQKNNISISFKGPKDRPELMEAVASSDLFFLPTKSENFGHSIFESLSLGVPVLISNNTPFKMLVDHDAGFDISLESISDFVDAIKFYYSLDGDKYQKYADSAKSYIFENNFSKIEKLKLNYSKLFATEEGNV